MKQPWLKIYENDILSGCPDIPSESCDIAVFSPPYKTSDGWSPGLMLSLGEVLERVLKPGGWAFMNFGQLSEDFGRPFASRDYLGQALVAHQTIIWVKSIVIDGAQKAHFQPINSDTILNYCHEYVFSYYKPPKVGLDKLAIGVPYADKSNLARGTRGKNGDLHCAGDVWFIPYTTTGGSNKKAHVYEYPRELVKKCIRLAGCAPGGTLYEPFLGSGQTVVVAKEMGLNAYGTDISDAALSVSRNRWEAE